jgi:hypothetical protein
VSEQPTPLTAARLPQFKPTGQIARVSLGRSGQNWSRTENAMIRAGSVLFAYPREDKLDT